MKRKNNIALYIIFGIVVILPYLGMVLLFNWYNDKVAKIDKAAIVIIDKNKMNLQVVGYKGETKASYRIACGKNYGDKAKQGDMKTPEGIFNIEDIQDASGWKHDFKDGKGEIDGAYGPWFIRLSGNQGIGIHGTHLPESIGTRATEGCIRLNNEDVLKLKKEVYVGMKVIIVPSAKDVAETANNKNRN